MIIWNGERCAGCGICTHFCPIDALTSMGTIEINRETCNDCLACLEACPVDALEEEK